LKNILLTGVAGFIGSKIAESLIQQGHSIAGIDNLKTGHIENVPEGVNFVIGDCADPEIFNKKPLSDIHFDTIIHFAGQSSGEISFDDPVQDLSDNCISTLNLLKLARDISCKSFIFASSMSVYGEAQTDLVNETHTTRPLSMYAVGKLASENYLKIYEQYGISSVSLRLFNTYGPGQNMSNLRQGMVSIYLAQAIENKNILVKGSPDRYRDFIYIDDVTKIVSYFVKNEIIGSEIYNVCTAMKTKVSTLIDVIKHELNKDLIDVEFTGSTPGDQFGIIGDNSKLLKKVGNIKFVNINNGMQKFVKSI
jgi:UDP-glucose 4-epimerase